MDYHQKYIKYKSKYFALKQIVGGNAVPDAIKILKGIAIPPELQALNNAFLPGFNIDSQYVDELLQYSRDAINDVITPIKNKHCRNIRNNLITLNKETNGLCETGDRNNNKTVLKATIESDLNKITYSSPKKKFAAENSQIITNQTQALTFFRTVEKIRIFPVENIATSTDIQIKKFQECDDYFVPGFNIDKAYVGHLIYYVLSMKNKTDVSSVYTKMKALNNKLELGINKNGDRLARKQNKLTKSEITFTENAEKDDKKEFSMDDDFLNEKNIVVTNPSLFISPNIN